ncbi:periplasmic heavy metal sensor [Methylopila turkensis]|uniref:Periplasmic heavy metal sensor n=1 Tax=Methylopila turkensis TaxID=1437816 RepID=A0A9W6JMJ5_9HYPH|nr:periplasmic heavy metal sensor [Methylopila turkensis]GLK80386.1 hypothetical protein GCM10008174_21270 [Methylopila turkensis]
MARRPVWLFGALALSVALNIAAAGFVMTSGPDKPPQRRNVDDVIGFVSQRYPDSVGDAVRARLEARRAELSQALSQMQAARRATRETISADPVDADAVRAAFEDARAKGASFQQVIHEAIAEALPAALPADRAKVARGEKD